MKTLIFASLFFLASTSFAQTEAPAAPVSQSAQEAGVQNNSDSTVVREPAARKGRPATKKPKRPRHRK